MNWNGPVLDFEKPIYELEKRMEEMRAFAVTEDPDVLSKEIRRMERELERLRKKVYGNLTRWQRVQIARHPMRPHTLDYVEGMTEGFFQLHGDRAFGDDRAMVTGLARLDGRSVAIVGHQKGVNTKENILRNFGMASPEGYRKALRIMKLAEKFGMPVISLVDTPGAYPGAGAEERGQAEAIARNIYEMGKLRVPIVVVVIGEGASGGALGIGVGDKILMMENAWYSTISPEACSTILWKDQEKAAARKSDCAEALRVAAYDLYEFGIVDEIVPEPLGGAHRDPEPAIAEVKKAVVRTIRELSDLSVDRLLEARLEKYSGIGVYEEA
ncbi:MAG: acetyl-CoA carboxylase carboxyltransferase subunit alpha [candidate division Zixibacteria bacterium]|nr:acetyl-CoA carboxylase carboxyltransferase subunit alpha [candidate division Zixibacteria bacterium]